MSWHVGKFLQQKHTLCTKKRLYIPTNITGLLCKLLVRRRDKHEKRGCRSVMRAYSSVPLWTKHNAKSFFFRQVMVKPHQKNCVTCLLLGSQYSLRPTLFFSLMTPRSFGFPNPAFSLNLYNSSDHPTFLNMTMCLSQVWRLCSYAMDLNATRLQGRPATGQGQAYHW